jgi:hypothetical protein
LNPEELVKIFVTLNSFVFEKNLEDTNVADPEKVFEAFEANETDNRFVSLPFCDLDIL